MSTPSRYLLLLVLAFSLATPALGKSKGDEVNYLDLAALMLRDGNLDRALVALQQVDSSDENLDRLRYYTLLGITHYRLQQFQPASDALQHAAKLEGADSASVIA